MSVFCTMGWVAPPPREQPSMASAALSNARIRLVSGGMA